MEQEDLQVKIKNCFSSYSSILYVFFSPGLFYIR